MISFDEAIDLVLQHTPVLGSERVALTAACGRVLAEALQAPAGWPLFDNSAVDGFGVRVADVSAASPDRPARLHCQATIRAGQDAGGCAMTRGETVRIFTGAMVPPDCEAVVMREDVEEDGADIAVRQAVRPGQNIRRRHAECRPSDQLLPAGTQITPGVVGLLAACGRAEAQVHRLPRVCVIGTGDELVAPGRPLLPGQIHDSNTYALAAALGEIGVREIDLYRVADDPQALGAQLRTALDEADVVLTIGGVSVGDYDFVKDICAAIGIEQVFWGVAMKPGKPNFFGVLRPTGRLMFGLPGNPVSALVSLRQLVFPSLKRMLGHRQVRAARHAAVLAASFRRRPGRLEFARGTVRSCRGILEVTALGGQDSHMLVALAQANCLLVLPADREHFEAGERLEIEYL